MGRPQPPRPGSGGDTGYRAPVAAGQQYPPLGYDEHGRPRYTYVPQPPPESPDLPASSGPPPEETGQTADAADAVSRPSRRGADLLGVGIVVAAMVIVVALALMVVWPEDDDTEIATPPPQVTFGTPDPSLGVPGVPRSPDQPRGPADPGADATGREVVYTVESTGRASVVYLEGDSVRIATLDGRRWSTTFTGTHIPLRITVVVQPGSVASCSIEVDGEVVATDEAGPDDPAGTLTCAA